MSEDRLAIRIIKNATPEQARTALLKNEWYLGGAYIDSKTGLG